MPQATTATRKKKAAKKAAKPKVPEIADIIRANRAALKAEATFGLAHKAAASRKKEWEGKQADLAKLISDAEKGQSRMFEQ